MVKRCLRVQVKGCFLLYDTMRHDTTKLSCDYSDANTRTTKSCCVFPLHAINRPDKNKPRAFFVYKMAPVASKIDVLSACHRDNTVVVVAIALLALTQIKPAKKKRKHRFWVHEILKKRLEQGAFRLATELVIHDSKFKEFLRLTREQFAVVLHLIEGDLERTSSVRVPISPRERLTVCLR